MDSSFTQLEKNELENAFNNARAALNKASALKERATNPETRQLAEAVQYVSTAIWQYLRVTRGELR